MLTEATSIADGVERRLDPQFVPFQRAVGWIVTASVSSGILIACVIIWLAGDLPWWMNLLLFPLWLAVSAGIGWLCYAWPVLEYRHTSYKVDAQGIDPSRAPPASRPTTSVGGVLKVGGHSAASSTPNRPEVPAP